MTGWGWRLPKSIFHYIKLDLCFFPDANLHSNILIQSEKMCLITGVSNMQKGCQKSHAVTIKLEQLVRIYVVSQKQDEETEMFGKDNQVRKTTQASVASLFFFSIYHICNSCG